MYCKKCGSQVNETDKFCKKCGEANNTESVVQSTPEVSIKSEPTPTQSTNNNQKGNNKTLITIISIVVGILVAVGVGYLVFNNTNNKPKSDKKESKNINDYEDDIVPNLDDDTDDSIIDPVNPSNDDDNNTTDVTNSSDTITYKKFNFIKLPGYTYEEKTDGLQVSDSSSLILLNIIDGSFDVIKNNSSKLEEAFTEKGYTVKNIQTKYYGANEYISAEISQGNLSMILLYGKADSSHIYVIVAASKSYTIDYSLIYKVNNIIKDAKYVG